MSHSRFAFVTLLLLIVGLLAACEQFAPSNPNVRPTPTLPLGTPASVQPTTPGQPSGEPGTLGGTIFDDANGNGARDADEAVIAGIHVSLAAGGCGSPVIAKTVTGAGEPSYVFSGLKAGDYCVSIDPQQAENQPVMQTGAWTFPQPSNGAAQGEIQLGPGEQQIGLDFGWKYLTAQPTELPQATQLPQATGQAQPTGQPTQPTLLPTPTRVSTNPTTVPPPACVFKAQYVADVTIADNTVLAPGQTFTKTWRVRNIGTCAWGPGSALHQLAFVGNNALGAPPSVEISNAVAVGAEADISVPMVAPAQAGSFESDWKLRADDDTLVGVGPANVALYVKIIVQAAPSPTPVSPPTGVPPTGVPPTAAPTSGIIQFVPGATEAEVQGTLPANGVATYSIGVQGQQTMMLALSSNSSSARVTVSNPNGSKLTPQRDNPEGTFWLGVVPTTGNYLIQVFAGNAQPTANFSMSVVVPQRISFAPGTDSASVAGSTGQGRIVTYLLKANGGQRMIAKLTLPPDSGGLTIYGLDDGQPLIRAQGGAPTPAPGATMVTVTFDGTLPATQDYVMQVVPGQNPVNYTLQITVQ